jgi:DNA-binding CsgD family transcriptional regulator
MKPSFDPIDLIERGYAPAASSIAWRDALGLAIARAMDPRSDFACAYCLDRDGPQRVTFMRTSGRPQAELVDDLMSSRVHYTPQALRTILEALRVPGLLTAHELFGRTPPSDALREFGLVDTAALVVHPADLPPLLFTTAARQPYRIDASQRAVWRKLAVHLSAGCRLAGRAASAEAADVECVMTPAGRVLDARGEGKGRHARERLRDAVCAIDRARTRRGRSDPHAALELWRGLFSGRWTLVDHFDSDGSRYLLARCNELGAAGPAALPTRQRQALFFAAAGWSNKEIGYALGISETTVASHLQRALVRVGAPSRAAWISAASELTSALKPA